MRVNLRGSQVDVPEQGLNVYQLCPSIQQIGGIGMAQLVRRDRLGDTRPGFQAPQVITGRLRPRRFTARCLCEYKLACR